MRRSAATLGCENQARRPVSVSAASGRLLNNDHSPPGALSSPPAGLTSISTLPTTTWRSSYAARASRGRKTGRGARDDLTLRATLARTAQSVLSAEPARQHGAAEPGARAGQRACGAASPAESGLQAAGPPVHAGVHRRQALQPCDSTGAAPLIGAVGGPPTAGV